MRDLGPVFANFPLGLEAYDAEGNLVAINEAAKAHFGITGEVSGVNILTSPDVREEIKEAFNSRSPINTRVLLDPARCSFSTTRQEAVWSRIRGFPGPESHKDLYFIIYEDISLQVAAAEAFGGEEIRSVLRLTNVDSPILGLDRGLRVILCNDPWAAWFSVEREQAEGKTVSELDKGYQASDVAKAVQNALLHAKTTTLTTTRHESTYEIDVLPASWGVFLRWRDVTKWLQAQDRLTSLAHSLNNLREEESRRLSRELHDVVGGNLASLSINLQALAKSASAAQESSIARARATAESTLATVRNLARALHPAMLEEVGLPNALATLAKHALETGGVPVAISVPKAWRGMDSPRALCIYRFVQEALTNVLRHAKASEVEVAGKESNGLATATVADNGRGFDPAKAPRGLGLLGMEERAALLGGAVAITSTPGQGTTATLTLPLAEALS